jgi:iron complex outermembrane receptor protein
MRTGFPRTVVVTAGVFVSTTSSAWAQSIDYGAFEEVFGEPVTTSATGMPERVSESPANLTIITADEIRQSGSRNIAEVLSRVPGLDVLQTSETTFDVGVRGYQQPQQPRLLVLVDGRQVFIDDYSRTVWDNIPVNINDIRQIEVVKGAASALFGSNAASGVINIVTYSPLYDDDKSATVRVGTQSSLTGDATITLKEDQFGTKTSLGDLTAEAFQTPHYALDSAPWNPRSAYISNSSVLKVSPALQLTSEFTYSTTRTYTGDPTDFDIAGDEKVTTYSVKFGAAWDSPYGEITATTYYNHSKIALVEPEDAGIPYGTEIALLVSQLQDRFRIGTDHSIRLGLEYRFRDYTQSGYEVIPQAPDLQQNIFAVSGTWLWQITPHLTWTNALRVDYESSKQVGVLPPNPFVTYGDYGHSLDALSANSDIVFQASDVDSFRGGYGRGVQLPSMIQTGYSQIFTYGAGTPAAFANDADANPRLKPTITQDISLDYERKIEAVSSTATISPYFITVKDIVAPFQPTDQTTTQGGIVWPVVVAQNIGGSHGWGAEFDLEGQNDSGFRWDASYSFAHVTDDAGVRTNIDYQGSAPKSTFRLLLGYSTGAWEFDAKGQHQTSTDMLRSPNGGATYAPIAVDGYTTLSGRIGYKLMDAYTLALSTVNLNEHYLYTSPYPAVERQVFFTLTGAF